MKVGESITWKNGVIYDSSCGWCPAACACIAAALQLCVTCMVVVGIDGDIAMK